MRDWSRALLVGLSLAFGLNTIAHAAHQHDTATAATELHQAACSYCITFGSLADAPTHRAPSLASSPDRFVVVAVERVPVSIRARSPAQPRAPPQFLLADFAIAR